jgi:hypothetical protein
MDRYPAINQYLSNSRDCSREKWLQAGIEFYLNFPHPPSLSNACNNVNQSLGDLEKAIRTEIQDGMYVSDNSVDILLDAEIRILRAITDFVAAW